uniref:Olfactory receptor n=1 Tax=Anser brachyrhynchus TaxID=132585 RepID=A0A8B9BV41_9AVES
MEQTLKYQLLIVVCFVTTPLTPSPFDSSQMKPTERPELGNHTILTEFFLSGLSNHPELQKLLFFTFCLIYTFTITGNLLFFIATVHPNLHMPMYFFLRVLSFLDVSTASIVVPKMLVNFLSEERRISYVGCATQLYFVIFLGATECYLLAAMAYDRYVAVCSPLRYAIIMNSRACFSLVLLSCASGTVVSVVQTVWVFTLPFCGPNKINYFFCDIPPLIMLSCTDTSLYEKQIITATVLVIFTPFCTLTITVISYGCIIITILHMPSSSGRKKTFSTCSAHLMVVTVFYSTSIYRYNRTAQRGGQGSDKVLSFFFSVVTQMLNPYIYSLRNNQVKQALKESMSKKPRHSNTERVF